MLNFEKIEDKDEFEIEWKNLVYQSKSLKSINSNNFRCINDNYEIMNLDGDKSYIGKITLKNIIHKEILIKIYENLKESKIKIVLGFLKRDKIYFEKFIENLFKCIEENENFEI